MIATTRPTAPRRAFTLVEVLVAMALIIFIMVILTEAFSAGTGVFRTLKAQGDMQEKLRATVSLLRDDLRQVPGRQTHFGDTDPFLLSALGINGNSSQPTSGYFYIQQPAQQFLPANLQFGSLPESSASNPPILPSGNPTPGPQAQESIDTFSVRMNTPMLQLTVNTLSSIGTAPTAFLPAICFTNYRRGTQPQDFFIARIPGKAQFPNLPAFTTTEQNFFNFTQTNFAGPAMPDYQQPVPLVGTTATGLGLAKVPMRTAGLNDQNSGFLVSQWAEIGYFLFPTGRTAGTTTPMPTYSLRRRIRVVLNDLTLNGSVGPGTLNSSSTFNTRIPVAPGGIDLWGGRYGEVSCLPDTSTVNNPVAGQPMLYFNSPKDLAFASPAPIWLANPARPTYLLPVCNPNGPNGSPVGQGCQTLVPPLSPVPVLAPLPQLTPVPVPQVLQQGLVPLGSTPPTGAVTQGRNDWAGDDIILTDVISFNVRVLALDRTQAQQTPAVNSPYSSDFLDLTDNHLQMITPQGNLVPMQGFYNTAPDALTGAIPNFTVTALEITVRVWDTKTSQTRQVTFVVEM